MQLQNTPSVFRPLYRFSGRVTQLGFPLSKTISGRWGNDESLRSRMRLWTRAVQAFKNPTRGETRAYPCTDDKASFTGTPELWDLACGPPSERPDNELHHQGTYAPWLRHGVPPRQGQNTIRPTGSPVSTPVQNSGYAGNG